MTVRKDKQTGLWLIDISGGVTFNPGLHQEQPGLERIMMLIL